MDESGFRAFLAERELDDEGIAAHLALAGRFEVFAAGGEGVDSPARPTADDVSGFVAVLIDEGENSWDNLVALARYGRFLGDDGIYVAILELLDGGEAMAGLHEKLGQAVGEELRDRVFEGAAVPPLGTPNTEKASVTRVVMERMIELVDADTRRGVLSGGLRHLEDAWYAEERQRFLDSPDLDAFIERKGDAFLEELERIHGEGRLFFSQPITAEVLEFVRAHREISHGVRDGDMLYEVKIPYATHEYLAETDERLRRYHYCHCPWVRESVCRDDVEVSPEFCQCSAGFHKKAWEVILDRPLEAEVVESVLAGDARCKIAIKLPADVLPEAER